MKPKSKYKILRRSRPKVTLLTDFYVFDTETGKRTRGGIQWHLNARPESFVFGVIYGRNYTRVIHDLKEFHNVLKEPRFKNRKMFAHNASYDLTVLYGNIFDVDPEAIFNGSRFICATNGNCMFADSLNIYKASVEDIGKMIGIQKPALGNDSLFSPEVGADEINRCTVDCQIVWEALYRIFEDAGDIKITQASLSMTYYRRFHQPFNIEHNDNTKYFFDSYFGGRTEAFKIGKTSASVIDVNSMYPDRMVKEVFPNPKFLKVEYGVSLKKLAGIMKAYEGCVYCTVVHKDFWLGYLPFRKDGKLMFPTGTFSGCWNFNELRYALKSGIVTIKKVDRVVYAPPMVSPFIDYVETLYLKRIKADNPLDVYRIKIFMNSLYGKFAQRITEETIYLHDMVKQYHVIEDLQRKNMLLRISVFNETRKDAFLIVKSAKHISRDFSIPSFASYITSGARIVLLDKLLKLKHNRPVYCDTDSIFYEIDTGVQSETHLGGWKKEAKIVTAIYGLKNYKYIDDKTGKELHRIKGIPKLSDKVISFNGKEVKKSAQLSDNRYQYFNLLNTKEAMRRNLAPGVLTKREKVVTGVYDKREVFSDGETKPINIK